MSHTQVQWGRGTTSQVAGYTGPQGEIVLNTDDGALHVQDGATAGGAWIVGGHAVNAQSGTSYTIAVGDQGELVTFDNASAVAVTLPQAGAAVNFPDGARFWALNRGAGTVTVTPTASMINGAANLALAQNVGALIVSDGTNYQAVVANPSGGGGGSLPTIGSGDVLGNAGAGSATASDTTVTALLDRAFGSTQGDILYRDSAVWKVLAPGTSGQVLETGGASADPSWLTLSAGVGLSYAAGAYSLSAPVSVGNGGTGLATVPAHALVTGNGTGALNSVGPAAAGAVLASAGTGSDPAFATSPTLAGLTIAPASGDADLVVNGAAGTSRGVLMQYAGSMRWSLLANNTTESGGNVGTDLILTRYDDTGTAIDDPIWVQRSNGNVQINGANVVPACVVQTGTGTIAVGSTDDMTIWDPTTPAATTFTLPSPLFIGERHAFKYLYASGGYTLTIAAPSGQTIDGAATQTIADPYAALTVVYIGSNQWIVI